MLSKKYIIIIKITRMLPQLIQTEKLIADMKTNNANLKTLFENPFENDIKRLSLMHLGSLKDKSSKQILMKYLQENRERFMSMILSEQLIVEFQKHKIQDLAKKQTLNIEQNMRKKMDNFYEMMSKKTNQSGESLSFFNEYAELSNDIRNGFKNTKAAFRKQPEHQLRMAQYTPDYQHKCQRCNQIFKNLSGLGSHKNFCKPAIQGDHEQKKGKNGKNKDVEKRQKRIRKRRFDNLKE